MLSLIDLQPTTDYILGKRGRDGGYLYYQCLGIFDSSAEDTYYAVKSLKLLGRDIPEPEKTVEFLLNLQRKDGSYPSLMTAYYSVKALAELGGEPRDLKGVRRYLSIRLRKILEDEVKQQPMPRSIKKTEKSRILIREGILRSWDLTDELYSIEMPSHLSDLFMIVDALSTINQNIDKEDWAKIIYKVLSYRREDGGFGAVYSCIDETFYALSTLHIVGYDFGDLKDTAAWVQRCEDPDGGFKVRPSISRAYSLSHLYYGLRSIELLHLRPRFGPRHRGFILRCLNGDGGFRESIHIGLSSLEATFYALSSMSTLEKVVAGR